MEYKSAGAISEHDLSHGYCLTEKKQELHVALFLISNQWPKRLWYIWFESSILILFSEQYLGGGGAGGGAESIQQAQTALCVCVGNLAAGGMPGQTAYCETLFMLLSAAKIRKLQLQISQITFVPAQHCGTKNGIKKYNTIKKVAVPTPKHYYA